MKRLLVARILTDKEQCRQKLKKHESYNVIEFHTGLEDSIGKKRADVLTYAIKNGYQYLTFVDPDDEVICEDYFILFPDGDLITCNKIRKEWTDKRLFTKRMEFKEAISPMVCHGPMNIINLQVCHENNLNYSDTWCDDPDFFIRYLSYCRNIYHTDEECYNHVLTPDTLSKSDRFLESVKCLIENPPKDSHEETLNSFVRWANLRFSFD